MLVVSSFSGAGDATRSTFGFGFVTVAGNVFLVSRFFRCVAKHQHREALCGVLFFRYSFEAGCLGYALAQISSKLWKTSMECSKALWRWVRMMGNRYV